MASYSVDPLKAGRPRTVASTASSDPSFASVKLLLQGGGTNGSTTIVDTSILPLSPATVAGNAQISTANQRFGTGCLAFDGTGDYIQYAANAAFVAGSGDFSYEFWVRPTDVSAGFRGIISQGYPTAGNFGVLLQQTTTTIRYSAGAFVFDATNALTLNTWSWIQLIRASGVTSLYVNGVLNKALADSYNFTLTNAITVGASTSALTETLFGQIVDLRVTIGVARAASFPVAQLPI
jgi:hypothetical protein